MERKKIRVLLTKSILDAHDRGVRVVAEVLKEAGMEVIFTRFGVAEEIVKIALEEDVDAVGISSSVSGYLPVTSEVMRLLKEAKMNNIIVILGGIIADDDVPQLLEMGVRRVFGPAEPTQEIAQTIQEGIIGLPK
jgi:methylmalonyl-CoA mutase C-terminal domain/subunit